MANPGRRERLAHQPQPAVAGAARPGGPPRRAVGLVRQAKESSVITQWSLLTTVSVISWASQEIKRSALNYKYGRTQACCSSTRTACSAAG